MTLSTFILQLFNPSGNRCIRIDILIIIIIIILIAAAAAEKTV